MASRPAGQQDRHHRISADIAPQARVQMDDKQPTRRKTGTYTVAALLGLFVAAALVALAGRLVPHGLARLARHRRHESEDR